MAGKTAEWVSAQIEAGLAGIDGKDVANMVIAYEPIWAIGTGKTATAEIADETCGVVRSTVEKLTEEKSIQMYVFNTVVL